MTKYSALLRQVDELASKVGQKQPPCLWIVVAEGEDQRPAMERALAEWQAAHPKATKRTVDDFSWIMWEIVAPSKRTPDIAQPARASPAHAFGDDDEKAKRSRRRLVYPPRWLGLKKYCGSGAAPASRRKHPRV